MPPMNINSAEILSYIYKSNVNFCGKLYHKFILLYSPNTEYFPDYFLAALYKLYKSIYKLFNMVNLH